MAPYRPRRRRRLSHRQLPTEAAADRTEDHRGQRRVALERQGRGDQASLGMGRARIAGLRAAHLRPPDQRAITAGAFSEHGANRACNTDAARQRQHVRNRFHDYGLIERPGGLPSGRASARARPGPPFLSLSSTARSHVRRSGRGFGWSRVPCRAHPDPA